MGEYARAVLTSDDVSIKVIDTQPLKKAAHELAKQGTNLNQFMKFLNTYGVKVFDPEEAKRVLEKEVSSFSEIMEALAALRCRPRNEGAGSCVHGERGEIHPCGRKRSRCGEEGYRAAKGDGNGNEGEVPCAN